MTDLRKEFTKEFIIGNDGEKDLTRKYTLKQMGAEDTIDCLPVIGEIFGVSLFSIIANSIGSGGVSGLEKELNSKLFSLKNKDALMEFFGMWKNNKDGVKEILKLMLKDGYYTVGVNDGSEMKKEIIFEEFTADDLMLIGQLFVFGIVEVNFRRFFAQFQAGLDSVEETDQSVQKPEKKLKKS